MAVGELQKALTEEITAGMRRKIEGSLGDRFARRNIARAKQKDDLEQLTMAEKGKRLGEQQKRRNEAAGGASNQLPQSMGGGTGPPTRSPMSIDGGNIGEAIVSKVSGPGQPQPAGGGGGGDTQQGQGPGGQQQPGQSLGMITNEQYTPVRVGHPVADLALAGISSVSEGFRKTFSFKSTQQVRNTELIAAKQEEGAQLVMNLERDHSDKNVKALAAYKADITQNYQTVGPEILQGMQARKVVRQAENRLYHERESKLQARSDIEAGIFTGPQLAARLQALKNGDLDKYHKIGTEAGQTQHDQRAEERELSKERTELSIAAARVELDNAKRNQRIGGMQEEQANFAYGVFQGRYLDNYLMKIGIPSISPNTNMGVDKLLPMMAALVDEDGSWTAYGRLNAAKVTGQMALETGKITYPITKEESQYLFFTKEIITGLGEISHQRVSGAYRTLLKNPISRGQKELISNEQRDALVILSEIGVVERIDLGGGLVDFAWEGDANVRDAMMKSAQNFGGGFFSEEDPLSSLWYPMVRHEEEIIIPEEARTNTEIAPRINAASEAQSSIAKQVGQALGGAALGVGKAAIGVFGQKAPGVTGRAVASPTITKTGKQALGFGKQILDLGIGVKQGLSKEGEL